MRQLTDITVTRVDFVDRGANKRKFLIVKRDGKEGGDIAMEISKEAAEAIRESLKQLGVIFFEPLTEEKSKDLKKKHTETVERIFDAIEKIDDEPDGAKADLKKIAEDLKALPGFGFPYGYPVPAPEGAGLKKEDLEGLISSVNGILKGIMSKADMEKAIKTEVEAFIAKAKEQPKK